MRTPEQQAILDFLYGLTIRFGAINYYPKKRRLSFSRKDALAFAEQAAFSRDYLEQAWLLESAEPPLAAPSGGLLLPTSTLIPGWFMPMHAFRISGLRYTPEHQAWDCNAPLSEPQRGGQWGSLRAGMVLHAGNDNRNVPISQNRGKHVIVDYGDGLIGCACHFDNLLVIIRDRVRGGQPLGIIGSTGYATGPHVHQWVERNGVRLDWIVEGHYTLVG